MVYRNFLSHFEIGMSGRGAATRDPGAAGTGLGDLFDHCLAYSAPGHLGARLPGVALRQRIDALSRHGLRCGQVRSCAVRAIQWYWTAPVLPGIVRACPSRTHVPAALQTNLGGQMSAALLFAGPIRRWVVLAGLFLALGLVALGAGQQARADAADPFTIDVQTSGLTVTLSGTWQWERGDCEDRWTGWAVDWGDPSAPGRRSPWRRDRRAAWPR